MQDRVRRLGLPRREQPAHRDVVRREVVPDEQVRVRGPRHADCGRAAGVVYRRVVHQPSRRPAAVTRHHVAHHERIPQLTRGRGAGPRNHRRRDHRIAAVGRPVRQVVRGRDADRLVTAGVHAGEEHVVVGAVLDDRGRPDVTGVPGRMDRRPSGGPVSVGIDGGLERPVQQIRRVRVPEVDRGARVRKAAVDSQVEEMSDAAVIESREILRALHHRRAEERGGAAEGIGMSEVVTGRTGRSGQHRGRQGSGHEHGERDATGESDRMHRRFDAHGSFLTRESCRTSAKRECRRSSGGRVMRGRSCGAPRFLVAGGQRRPESHSTQRGVRRQRENARDARN